MLWMVCTTSQKKRKPIKYKSAALLLYKEFTSIKTQLGVKIDLFLQRPWNCDNTTVGMFFKYNFILIRIKYNAVVCSFIYFYCSNCLEMGLEIDQTRYWFGVTLNSYDASLHILGTILCILHVYSKCKSNVMVWKYL